ncbi:cytochrome P450 [Hymenopellis radicata]|nr:cytochrome P450 [Hymenopellis radicata]
MAGWDLDGMFVKETERLPKIYGPIVRIRPNELHFGNPEAYFDIYKTPSHVTKEPSLYKCFNETKRDSEPSLLTSRDSEIGIRCPRKGRFDFVIQYTSTQRRAIRLTSSSTDLRYLDKPVNLFQGFKAAMMDVVTTYCYAHSFNGLNDAHFRHPIFNTAESAVPIMTITRHFPALHVLNMLSSISSRPISLIDGVLKNRGALTDMQHETIYHHLVTPELLKAQDVPSKQSLMEEAIVLLIAGTDISSNTMSIGFFHLLSSETAKKKLAEELAAAWPDKDEMAEKLPHLTAVIKESLRMSIGIPFSLPRLVNVPTVVDGVIIRQASSFVLKNPDRFPEPNVFKPERWLDPDSHDISCLAWCELYLVFSHIIRKFEMEIHDTKAEDIQFRVHAVPIFRGKPLHATAGLTNITLSVTPNDSGVDISELASVCRATGNATPTTPRKDLPSRQTMSTQPLFNAIHHPSWHPHTLGYSALAHNTDSYDDTSEDESSGSDVESSSGSEGYMTPSESSELETCPVLDLTFELFPEIYSFLSPLDIVCWGMTAKVFQQSVTDYYAANLARLLGRFFDTPEEIRTFREVQRDYGMFISGSSGVQFLDNIHFPGSDLDLYVESRHGLAIGSFLLALGYEYTPRPTQPEQFDYSRGVRSYYTHSGIAGVYTFCRGGQKVQLITSKGPPLEIVFLFHSTPPMNIITYNRVYSLYPKATFEERRGLIVTQSQSRPGSVESNQYGLQKYRDRGWTLSSVTENHAPKSDFRPGLRWVGDGRCLSLHLPPIEGAGLFETTEAPSSIPTLEHSSWTVKPSRPGANTVDFDVHVLSLGDFRYAFSAATHLGRVIQSPEMTRSLQWATGCSWDDIYKVVAPQFLARQSVERFQNATRTYEWFESAGTKLRLMAEVLAMLARRSGEHSVRA